MKKTKQATMLIRGDEWKIYLIPEKQFEIEHGEDAAVTISHSKEIHISSDSFTFRVILHEIMHAYISYFHIGSTTEISQHDLEEMFCDLISKYSIKMILDTFACFKKFKKKIPDSFFDEITEDQTKVLKKIISTKS